MRAVVIGGSMAGLLCARVLSDLFDEVVVLDRDDPPSTADARKGVPQGQHVHCLLAAGTDVIGAFFPGIYDEMTAEGALRVDAGADVAWFNRGTWRAQARTGVEGYVQSRPFLEMHVRRRVAGIANVQQRPRTAVTGLLFESAGEAVTGIRMIDEAGQERTLAADFVVDCSGRGSKTPSWLEAAGYRPPSLTTVVADVGYVTQLFKPSRPVARDWTTLVIQGRPPTGTRYGAAFRIENDVLQVTLVGQFKDYPPQDNEGFLRFAESLEHKALADTLRDMVAISPVAMHRFPKSVWQRYERLERLPRRFLVAGDAILSVNPVYGQGMTVLSLEMMEMRKILTAARQAGTWDADLARAYFPRAAKIAKAAWTIATSSDLSYPQATGARPPLQGLTLWYVGQIVDLCSYDPAVLKSWLQVTHLQRPVSELFKPGIVARVLRRVLTGGAALPVERPIRLAAHGGAAE